MTEERAGLLPGVLRRFPRALPVLVVLAAVVTGLILWSVRLPATQSEAARAPFLGIGEELQEEELLGEQVFLLDPSALFLPSEIGYAQRLLESVELVGRRELFGVIEMAPMLGSAGFERSRPEFSALPQVRDLARPGIDLELRPLGQLLPPPVDPGEVLVRFERLDGDGVIERRLPRESVTEALERPVRMLVRLEPGRNAGTPLLLDAGGEDGAVAVARRLVLGVISTLQPMGPGLWEVSVLW